MPPFDLDINELHRLRGLAFAARIPAMLGLEGSRRVRRSGEGLEFLDFRPYVPGDDPRHIDWNLYGRMRQLFVRVFESQKYLSIGILVDVSRSMAFGEPVQKVTLACQLACALGFVGLSRGEHVSTATFGARLEPVLGPLRGIKDTSRLRAYLQASPPSQDSALCQSIREFCGQVRSRGLLIVLSDFLVAEGYEKGLRLALAHGRKLLVVQVLDETDLAPRLEGRVRLRDSETGQERFVDVDPALLARYRRCAGEYCDGLAAFCRAYGQYYVRVSTRDHYLETVGHTIRSSLVLQ